MESYGSRPVIATKCLILRAGCHSCNSAAFTPCYTVSATRVCGAIFVYPARSIWTDKHLQNILTGRGMLSCWCTPIRTFTGSRCTQHQSYLTRVLKLPHHEVSKCCANTLTTMPTAVSWALVRHFHWLSASLVLPALLSRISSIDMSTPA